MTQESMLFDVKVAMDDGVVVMTATSAFESGITLRMERNQAQSLLASLTNALAASVDVEALQLIVAAATWEDEGDGYSRYVGHNFEISDALAWGCGTCRDDVGWSKFEAAHRDPDGTITLEVDCGHCGYQMYYNTQGDQLDDH